MAWVRASGGMAIPEPTDLIKEVWFADLSNNHCTFTQTDTYVQVSGANPGSAGSNGIYYITFNADNFRALSVQGVAYRASGGGGIGYSPALILNDTNIYFNNTNTGFNWTESFSYNVDLQSLTGTQTLKMKTFMHGGNNAGTYIRLTKCTLIP